MKIWMQHKLGGSGKGKFIERLCDELDMRGVKWSRERKGCDVCLGVIKWAGEPGMPSVLRIDGAHFYDDKRRHWINKMIRKSCKTATAIIWQSTFCKKMGHSFLKCKPRKEFIIHNGALPGSEDEVKDILRLRILRDAPNARHVLLCARFRNRPQKGLKEMLKLARAYCQGRPEVTFAVCGKADEKYVQKYRSAQIKFVGNCEDVELRYFMLGCDALLYLASYDWCPNSVVEAQVLGLPVVYIKGHALDELVGEHGVGIASGQALKLGYTRSKLRPVFDRDEAVAAIERALEWPHKVVRPDLHIETITTKYLEALQWAMDNG